MRLLFVGPLRSWIRGSRGRVWDIASSAPGTGSHCGAEIQVLGVGGVCRARHHLTKARPNLPLPPHTGIPKCLVTLDLPNLTTHFSICSLRTLCGLATVKDCIVLLYDLRVGLFLSWVRDTDFCVFMTDKSSGSGGFTCYWYFNCQVLMQISQWFSFFPLIMC